MSGERQSASKQIFVPSDKESVFNACVKAGEQVGTIGDKSLLLGAMNIKTGFKFWPPRNPVTMSISIIPAKGGQEVRCEAEGWDGAIGFGSAPKSIAEFCAKLAELIVNLPPAAPEPDDKPKAVSNLDEIKKLKELLDNGAITQAEFDAKKKNLLQL